MHAGNLRFLIRSAMPPKRDAGMNFISLKQLRRLRGSEQVAAVCYQISKRGLEFLLVRTRNGRWTFPKGSVESGLTHAQAAALEAFEEAGVTPKDIKYASIYDSFTITVLMQLEDLGFCKKGEGGKFVADGNLISGVGKLPFNTDGGGLCSNHPVNRGGMTKILEAVRQLRGEAHPKVQVPNCDLAVAHGTGGLLGVRHAASTCILERV